MNIKKSCPIVGQLFFIYYNYLFSEQYEENNDERKRLLYIIAALQAVP